MVPMNDDDWSDLLVLANTHLLTPSLAAALEARRYTLPRDVVDYLDHIVEANRVRNDAVRRQAQELIRAFNRIGIVPLLLKGVLMALHENGIGARTRMMADIDVVVLPASKQQAIDAMHRLGYRARMLYPQGHHAVGEFVRDGDAAAVDLHLELIDQNYILPAAEAWSAAETARSADVVYRVPSPTHRVLHNILHAQIHHRGGFYLGEMDLRQLYELAYLARTYRASIDWPGIEERLSAHRLGVMLHSYLSLAGRIMGLAWPLPRPCCPMARFHAWRCRLQVQSPILGHVLTPWANLRSALAWHRMAHLYGLAGGSPILWRWRHIAHLFGSMRWAVMVEKLMRP